MPHMEIVVALVEMRVGVENAVVPVVWGEGLVGAGMVKGRSRCATLNVRQSGQTTMSFSHRVR